MTHADIPSTKRVSAAVTNLAFKKTVPINARPPVPLRPEVLFISSYPPRECGLATYTQDLVRSISEKFNTSLAISICALENDKVHRYPAEVKYTLQTSQLPAYEALAVQLNQDENLLLVMLQHEFGLYGGMYGQDLLALLRALKKPVVTTFHTILPAPDAARKKIVQAIAARSVSVIVMTRNSAGILASEYGVAPKKIQVIAHGTHLSSPVTHTDKAARHHLGNRMVLTTFGLLSPGKSIETALDALPAIIARFPNILYLIIGKTHPGVVAHQGETYRQMLEQKVLTLHLQGHVRFINKYLPLNDLLAYLQRTDVYLFTSKDPHQAVSGTFAYAMGCGCPVISTPIPHAKEILAGAGVIVDFQQPNQLADVTIKLLSDANLMQDMKLHALHKIQPTAWPNAALAHVEVIMNKLPKPDQRKIRLHYNLPPLSLAHIRKLTTSRGIIQFSRLSSPDAQSGLTIDDNARALIALCHYYQIFSDASTLRLIDTYLDFIIYCQGPLGTFSNYVDIDGVPDTKNQQENLEDANGRAFWALGEFLLRASFFKKSWIAKAESAFAKALPAMIQMRSPRALSFVLKGLCCYPLAKSTPQIRQAIVSLADDLVSKYRGVSTRKWQWFENYLTYANGVLPEALLCAYLATGNELFKTTAKSCFDFLMGLFFQGDSIKVVSNQGWLKRGEPTKNFGEQPIDVAYTILALDRFHQVFPNEGYQSKMTIAFSWFLGKNHLHQIMYNPATGGCYDGLEEHHINLNQGAESTVSYLLSRLMMEKSKQASALKPLKLVGAGIRATQQLSYL
jgi:glycosyltransferase involved in cell wall biosynthesis